MEPRLRVRQAGAATLTAGLSLFMAYEGITQWRHGPIAPLMAALLGAAAFGFTRSTIGAQVRARGVVWLVFGTLASVFAARPFVHMPHLPAWTLPVLLASGAALALARPLLHTPAAEAAFAPARFRRTFLTGATATVSAAVGALGFAVVGVHFHSPVMIAFNAGLAVVLMLSVRGLLAMRTWGALLGALASAVCLALVPVYGRSALTLCLAAAPMLLFWILPLVLASRRSASRAAVDDLLARPMMNIS